MGSPAQSWTPRSSFSRSVSLWMEYPVRLISRLGSRHRRAFPPAIRRRRLQNSASAMGRYLATGFKPARVSKSRLILLFILGVTAASMSSPSTLRLCSGMPMASMRLAFTRQLPILVLTSPDMRVPST